MSACLSVGVPRRCVFQLTLSDPYPGVTRRTIGGRRKGRITRNRAAAPGTRSGARGTADRASCQAEAGATGRDTASRPERGRSADARTGVHHTPTLTRGRYEVVVRGLTGGKPRLE